MKEAALTYLDRSGGLRKFIADCKDYNAEYCLDFVPYGIKHLISGEIFARVSKDEHGIGTASIEAGSALLASDGICFLGDLSLYKKDKLELLCSAEAHAKLCLRKKVLEEDAVIAVILFENSLSLKYGTSALLVPHNALFPFEVYNQDTLHQRDLYLTECHHQILNYVQTFAPGAANYFSEE
ncbi:MCMD2 protein, partial [Polypterus senegalus]